ncbi:hypothetical protein [Streptomyces sp. NPDC058657]|uniref:hypothetical protein n=1 Tax=unclassified Streptomyces TaxID=2593676 RepID=UPI003659496B
MPTSTPDRSEQGTHHWILTMDLPGHAAATTHGTFHLLPGQTRQDVFVLIRRSMVDKHPSMARANVVFFSFEPNRL